MAGVGVALGLAVAAGAAVGASTDPDAVAAWIVGTAAVATLVGAARASSEPVWWSFGLGLAAMAGALASGAPSGAFAESPVAADPLLIAGGASMVAGLAGWVPRDGSVVSASARADAVVSAAAVGAAAVVFGSTDVGWSELEAGARVVAVATVVSMALTVGAAVGAAMGRVRSAGLVVALGGAVAMTLGAPAARAAQLGVVEGSAQLGVLSASGAVALAVACWLPMRRDPLGTERDRPPVAASVVLAVCAAALPLGAAVLHGLLGDPASGRDAALGTAVVALVVAARFGRNLVDSGLFGLARDRATLDALADAVDEAQVRAVLLERGRALLGPGATLHWVERAEGGPLVLDVSGQGRDLLGAATLRSLLDDLGTPGSVGRVGLGAVELTAFDVATRRRAPAAVVVASSVGLTGTEREALGVLCLQGGLALDALGAHEAHAPRGAGPAPAPRGRVAGPARPEPAGPSEGVPVVRPVVGASAPQRLAQVVAHLPDVVVIVDREAVVEYASPSIERVLGLRPDALVGGSVVGLTGDEDADHLHAFLARLSVSPAESVRTTELAARRGDGTRLDVEVVGTNLLASPGVEGLVLSLRDATGRRVLEEQLRHQAFHDPLTGLANRALFRDRLDHAIRRARRTDDPPPVVAFIDLDDFKVVNDTLGHAAGDELLSTVADRIRSCLRAGDTPARLGGDEFAVLLEDPLDDHVVAEVAERLLQVIAQPLTVHGTELRVSASIGVAHHSDGEASSDDLLRNADLAMYAAKSAGKGTVAAFEPSMRGGLLGQMAIRHDLERSVARAEIGLAYQPIVELRSGRVVAFEALARWTHPARGPVAPLEFLPVAEESGAIVALGRQVIERGCVQVARWRRQDGGRDWALHVNLSLREVLWGDVVAGVRGAASRAGLPMEALVVEVPAKVFADGDARVARHLGALRDAGRGWPSPMSVPRRCPSR